MNFSPLDLLEPKVIIQDVQMLVDDENFKKFSFGYYVSLIQQGLDKIEYETFFHKMFTDIPLPTDNTLRIPLPSGAFNILDVYLINKDEHGKVTEMQNIFTKQGTLHQGHDMGEVSRMQDGVSDSHYYSAYTYSVIHTCSVGDGYITLSDSCNNYKYIRVQYNGLSTSIGDVPFIPRHFRTYMIDYATERCFRILKARDPRYKQDYMDAYQRCYMRYDGSLDEAKRLTKSLDSKYKKDLLEYFMKMQP